MMILRSSPASPFGRKVKIAAYHLGLMDDIDIQPTNVVDPQDAIRQQNPLGKIPALILDDGSAIYDSPVILEFLDEQAGGGKILPKDGTRMPALILQALADGIMDAGILQIYEKRMRTEQEYSASWVGYQSDKVERGLDWLENNIPGEGVDVGTITLACALGYLDFRFGGEWRKSRPALVKWVDGFAARVPSYKETAPHD